MKNIMKSIWYEILRSKFMIKIYILFVLVMGLTTVLNVGDSVQKGHTSGMLAGSPNLTYFFPLFMVGFIVAVICGEDYKDKVAHYEILSGHSRISIYLARTLMGIIVGSVLTLVLSFIPILVGIMIDGWGNKLILSDVIVRHMLFFFPYVRLSAFIAMLTFLIKNPYIIMAISFVITDFGMLVIDILASKASLAVSLFNLKLLTEYDGWSIYNLDPHQGIVQYFSYDSSVSSGMVIGTIVVSLVMAGLYLFMGYALFRRDELN